VLAVDAEPVEMSECSVRPSNAAVFTGFPLSAAVYAEGWIDLSEIR
jgi:hypothetical protein